MNLPASANILVTGGAGFIGSRIAKRLLADGHRVIIIDDLSTGYRHNVPEMAEFAEGDIANAEHIGGLPWAEIDAVMHLAAQASGEISRERPVLDLDTNVRGTFLLLKAAHEHGVRRFLYASSMAAYGDLPCECVGEETLQQPLSFYGISKKCAEEYVRWFQRHGLSTTTFRMFSVYGPGQDLTNMKQGMVSIFMSFLLEKQPVHVKGSLDRFRDFVYIDDVVEAWCRALYTPAADGATLNLGTGIRTSVGEMVETLIRSCELPSDHPVHSEGSTPDDQLGLYADISRLKETLQWQPEISLESGLGRMFAEIQRSRKEQNCG